VAFTEIHSAFARLRREEFFSASQYTAACKSFDSEFEFCHVVNLATEIFALTRTLATKHGLKTLDLIHLACAVHLHGRFGHLLGFAAADRQLLRAAEAEGMHVVDVENVTLTKGKRL
jgi:predicted nucleic acid-binding protein